jgi:Protein of unknown function (DUF3122)
MEKLIMFKKLIQTILIGCAIALCFFTGIDQSQSFAAALPASINLQSDAGGKISVSNIRELKESSGQMVYQARQTLKDQHGNNWQAIAFERIRNDGQTSFYLRLVGFPKLAEIDRSQPLILTNSLGKILTATDSSNDIFTDSFEPQPNVGQYNLQPVLSQLQAKIPLKLSLPIIGDEAISLSVPPSFVEEWQTIANYR